MANSQIMMREIITFFFCPSLIFIHIIIGFSYLLLNVSTYHFSLLYLQINIKIYFGRDLGLPSTFATNVQCLIVICDKVSQYLPAGSSFSLGILVSSAIKILYNWRQSTISVTLYTVCLRIIELTYLSSLHQQQIPEVKYS